MIKIIIADDHPGMREAWHFILSIQHDMEVVAICENGHEAIGYCTELLPDLVLMDINMQPMTGFVATEILLSRYPELKIIGISIHAEPSYAQQMLKIGGKGFITKSSTSEEMITGIRHAAAGNIYICEEVRSRMHLTD